MTQSGNLPTRLRVKKGRVVLAAYAAGLGVALLGGAAARDAHPIAVAAAADAAATVAVFAFSFALRNSSLYDPYWSVAPLPIALFFVTVARPEAPGARQLLVLAAVAAWGARLTWNWWSGWRGLEHEDWRYVRIREQTGRLYWPVSFLGIHLFPTVMVFLGCLALWPALAAGARPLGVLDGLAVLVTAASVALEARADQQLRRFRESPDRRPGDILASGLWARSRHPNYLGEMGFWWGLWLFGVAAAPSDAWWTLVGPVAMVAMFRFISVPMLDRRMRERRPAYAEHARVVPALWPRLRGAPSA